MKNIFLLLIISLLLFSCQKDEKVSQEVENIFGFTSMEKAEEELGSYANFMALTNGSVSLRSTLYKHANNYEQGEIFARYIDNSIANRSDGGEYKVGDISLIFDPIQQKYLPQEGVVDNDGKVNILNPLFGKTKKMSLSRNGELLFETEKYIPEKLSIEFLNGTEIPNNTSLIGMKRNEFELSWNSDDNNENGIIVFMIWRGDRTDVSPHNQTDSEIVRKAIKLDDTGNKKISKDFFTDIPKNAVVALFTMRGDISIHEVEGKSFRFSLLSEEKSNLVLLD